MFKVVYHYSACISVLTGDLRILCDPWFTEGAYDGAWYQFPRLENPISKIGEVDYIYISHIHPDHYDPVFLRQYLAVYPKAKIVIASFSPNYLLNKMIADGFNPEVAKKLEIGKTSLNIIPNELNPYDVDSVLIVSHDGRSVVNLNDNLFNESLIEKIKLITDNKIDLCCLGYTGAGPYPQTYYSDLEILVDKASAKKTSFFERYRKMIYSLQPKWILPFAGKYLLGGKHAYLNKYRGVADAVEVLNFAPNTFVLEDGGSAWFDVESGECSSKRTSCYSESEINKRISEISGILYDYERDFSGLRFDRIPFSRLLSSAYKNAIRKSLVKRDYYLIFNIGDLLFVINTNSDNPTFKGISSGEVETFSPRSSITIDYRYLFGLITMIYHWNNAEIGSHYMVERSPDVFDRDVQAFLNHLHV